jgi:chaperone required for assembly of F1-ATPase
MSSVMVRVGITPYEWHLVRELSKSSGVPVTRLVADAIRESLLKGAKP